MFECGFIFFLFKKLFWSFSLLWSLFWATVYIISLVSEIVPTLCTGDTVSYFEASMKTAKTWVMISSCWLSVPHTLKTSCLQACDFTIYISLFGVCQCMFSFQTRGAKNKIPKFLLKDKLPLVFSLTKTTMFGFYLSPEEGNSLVFSPYYLAEAFTLMHRIDKAISYRKENIFCLNFIRWVLWTMGFEDITTKSFSKPSYVLLKCTLNVIFCGSLQSLEGR